MPKLDTITTFDNLQVIQSKRAIKPHNVAKSSVITNRSYMVLQPAKEPTEEGNNNFLQGNPDYSPRTFFSVT